MCWSPTGTTALLRAIGPRRDDLWDQATEHHAALAQVHEERALGAADEASARQEFSNAAAEWGLAQDSLRAAGAWLRAGDATCAVLAWQQHAGHPDQAVDEAVTFAGQLEQGGEAALAAQVLDGVDRDDLVDEVCDRAVASFVGDQPWTARLEPQERDADTGRTVRAVAALVDPGDPYRRWEHQADGDDAVRGALQALLDALEAAAREVERLEGDARGWALICDGRLPDWMLDGSWRTTAVEVQSRRELSGQGHDPLGACEDLRRKLRAVGAMRAGV